MAEIDPTESQRIADEAYDRAWERQRKGFSTFQFPPPEPPPKTEWERMLKQADALDEQARGFIGCSFIGEHPATGLREQASQLRRAALILKQAADAKTQVTDKAQREEST